MYCFFFLENYKKKSFNYWNTFNDKNSITLVKTSQYKARVSPRIRFGCSRNKFSSDSFFFYGKKSILTVIPFGGRGLLLQSQKTKDISRGYDFFSMDEILARRNWIEQKIFQKKYV